MDELELQLQQLRAAYAVASESDKEALGHVISELESLISVSNTGESESKPSSSNNLVTDELNADSNNEAESAIEQSNQNDNGISSTLMSLQGMRCRAPFKVTWGQTSYHNATVVDVEIPEDSDQVSDLQDINVRVLFTEPLSKSMLPCQFFLEGRCTFIDGDRRCKFSHGEVISVADLREYKETDYEHLQTGTKVNAKFTDSIWYPAVITSIKDDGECEVRFDIDNTTLSIPLHETSSRVVENDDISSSSDSSDSDSSSSSDMDNVSNIASSLLMFKMESTMPLGQWEKYTKGIGSKLMSKMGYVIGTGLGKNSEGRVLPVDAVVLPPGRSLDACMELKEKSGDGNLFSCDKRMRRIERKQKQREETEKKKTETEQSMFNFLNQRLNDKLSKDTTTTNKNKSKHPQLNKDTLKALNQKAMNISDNIRTLTKDIAKVKDGIKRNEGRDEAMKCKLQEKLCSLEDKLKSLRQLESKVAHEQNHRKDKNKLTLF